jgi:hypothetical protein
VINDSVWRGAILTVITLFGGLLVGLAAGSITFHFIPGSSVTNVNPGHAAIAAVPALIGFLAGGAAWGMAMGRLAGAAGSRRLAWAGLLGFGPLAIILAAGLSFAEPPLVARYGASTGIHRIFTLLFVPTAFLIAGVSAGALGLGLRDKTLAFSLFWRVGLTAAFTFLLINLAMEAAGWVVGAPGAAERATMLTVMAAGNLGAALAGGGVLGWLLADVQVPLALKT